MASSFSFANIKSIIRLEFVSIRGDKNFAFNTANCLDVLNSFLSRSISKNKSNKSNKSFSNSRYFSSRPDEANDRIEGTHMARNCRWPLGIA